VAIREGEVCAEVEDLGCRGGISEIVAGDSLFRSMRYYEIREKSVRGWGGPGLRLRLRGEDLAIH